MLYICTLVDCVTIPRINKFPHQRRTIQHAAKIIVYTLSRESCSQTLLKQLLDILEPYYHPSNDGEWTSGLANFLHSLCISFGQRLGGGNETNEFPILLSLVYKREIITTNPGNISERQHGKRPGGGPMLDAQSINDFVSVVLPLVMTALLSKRDVLASQGQSALKCLACMLTLSTSCIHHLVNS